MKLFPVLGMVAAIFLCACGRQPVQPAATAAPAPVPQIAIRSLPFVSHAVEPAAAATNHTNRITWEVTLARIPEGSIQQLGLGRLFGTVAEKNDLTFQEIDRSPLMQLARQDSNIVLFLRSGVCAGACPPATTSNLLDDLRDASGVEIVDFQRIHTITGQPAIGALAPA